MLLIVLTEKLKAKILYTITFFAISHQALTSKARTELQEF